MTDTPRKTITASFDPAFMGTMIELWRNTTDLVSPSSTELTLHFIQNRRQILQNLSMTASGWSMMLKEMTPDTPESDAALQEACAIVGEFRDWAKAEIKTLDDMAMSEAISAGWDDLVATDPELAQRMQHAFAKLRNPPPPPDTP